MQYGVITLADAIRCFAGLQRRSRHESAWLLEGRFRRSPSVSNDSFSGATGVPKLASSTALSPLRCGGDAERRPASLNMASAYRLVEKACCAMLHRHGAALTWQGGQNSFNSCDEKNAESSQFFCRCRPRTQELAINQHSAAPILPLVVEKLYPSCPLVSVFPVTRCRHWAPFIPSFTHISSWLHRLDGVFGASPFTRLAKPNSPLIALRNSSKLAAARGWRKFEGLTIPFPINAPPAVGNSVQHHI